MRVVIEVEFSDNMKMSIDNAVKNIKYVLDEHFKEMENYTKVYKPAVKVEIK